MKLREKEFFCPKCDEKRLFIELEPIYPKTSLSYIWAHSIAEETGAINPYFICRCGYAERLYYLEYPERKPPPSFLSKKWTAFLSAIEKRCRDFVCRIKENWAKGKRLK